MRCCAALLGFVLLTAPLAAQRLLVSDPTAAAVVVERATITAEVTGRIAVTTYDLVFRNPNGRVLEGSFEFPLLDGRRVVRFALDIDGHLREAVPVEKVKARATFEAIERRGVDPGLLEQTEGNLYRARVYPIPASGTRRIVIAYQEDLGGSAASVGSGATDGAGSAGATVNSAASGAGGSGARAVYRLPLEFPEVLTHFALTVRLAMGEADAAQARTTLAIELPAWRDQRELAITREGFVARGLFELSLPAVERPRAITERRGERDYVYAEVPVPLARPAARGERGDSAAARAKPAVVGVLWDASGSGAARDHARDEALLAAWLAALGDVEVRLVELRDVAGAPRTFHVRGGGWDELRAALHATVYDGASSLDGWAPTDDVAEWLLISDGLFNYGAPVSAAVARPGVRVLHAALSASRADPDRLRALARRHGGEFLDLLAVEPAEAARRLHERPRRVLAVDHDPQAITQVFPEVGAPLEGDTVVLTGVLRRATADVTLRLGTSDADAETVTVTLRAGDHPGQLAARAWAAAKIAALAGDPEANREDLRRTSVEFGIVTPDTSLLVLETLEDYVTYDIAPPPELRKEWDARQRGIVADRRKATDAQLDRVAAMLRDKVAWWEKAWPKGAPPARPAEDKVARHGVFSLESPSLDANGVGAAAPAPPPATAAPRASRRAPDGTVMQERETLELSPFQVLGVASGSGGEQRLARAADVRRREGLGTGDTDGTGAGAAGPAASITLQPWQPNAGYLDRLRRAPAERRLAIYLEERVDHAREPGFFLAVGGFFLEAGEAALGLRVLSNLAELAVEDVPLLRVLAHRLAQADRPELAAPLFARVLRLRADEPQSYRDLALVLARTGEPQRAAELLWEVVSRPWADRFPDIELIALGELNALAAASPQPLDLSRVEKRFRRHLPVDVRVVLTWDANDCDIDLWVTDPNDERTFYSAPLSYQGGRMSRDFTGGYGPEEFLLRDAKPGKYRVQINYFGDRRQAALGPVTAQVRIVTGFGTPLEREQRLTVRLADKTETLDIGAVEIGGK